MNRVTCLLIAGLVLPLFSGEEEVVDGQTIDGEIVTDGVEDALEKPKEDLI